MKKKIKTEEYSKWDKNLAKEPTPLEALEILKEANTIYCDCASNLFARYRFEIETIETALKRLEIIDKLNEKHCEDTQNKLKALEIIKEKNVDIVELKRSIDLQQYNSNHFSTSKDLLGEQFDLLKEVLK